MKSTRKTGPLPGGEQNKTDDLSAEGTKSTEKHPRAKKLEKTSAVKDHQGAEWELESSEERFRKMFDNGPLGMAVSDSQYHFVRANTTFCQMLGYTEQEIKALSFKDITLPDDLGDSIEKVHQLEQGIISVYKTEKRYITRNKDIIWGSLTLSQIRGSDKTIQFFLVMIEDITERKRAEETIELLRKSIDIHYDGAYWTDGDNKFIYVNDAGCKALGYTREELIGKTFSFINPRATPEAMARTWETLRNKGFFTIESMHRRKDGSEFPVEIVTTYVQSGGKEYTCGFARDITDRKRAEVGIRQSEERYRTLAEATQDIIIITNLDGDLEYINRFAAARLGMNPDSISGKNLGEVFPKDVTSRQLENIKKVFKNNEPLYVEATTPLAGNEFWLGTWLFPLKDETGKVKSVLIDSRDITVIKQAEQSLRASESRFRGLFEDSPISLWEEDFSQVKQQIENLRGQGVLDFREYLKTHSDVVLELVKKIRIIDANKATLALVGAANKEQLIENLKKIMRIDDAENYVDEFASIAEGKTEFEWEGINHTLKGDELTVSLRWSAAPGYTDSLEKVLVSMIDISERRRAEKALALRTEELRQRNEELTRLNDQAELRMARLVSMRTIDMAISGSFDLSVVLGIILDQVTGQLGSHAADILVFSQGSQAFKYSSGKGFHTQGLEHSKYMFGSDLAWRVVRERRRVEISDMKAQSTVLQRTPDLSGENFLSYIGVPLVSKGQVRGVLEVFHRVQLNPDREWYNYLEMLAGQAAIAMDNSALFEHIQNSNTELGVAYDSTLMGWAYALELRALEPDGHIRRVDNLTTRLAQAMGLNDKELVNIHRGAILHDIGKMGVPDSITLKPGSLTDEEWVIMRKHPQYAYDMLSPITYLRQALDIPHYHHERWDGSGYPRGMKGDGIPLAARIFAVVDVFDALISDRPYRKAWSEMKALEYIQQKSGVEFDPQVVNVFLEQVAGKGPGA